MYNHINPSTICRRVTLVVINAVDSTIVLTCQRIVTILNRPFSKSDIVIRPLRAYIDPVATVELIIPIIWISASVLDAMPHAIQTLRLYTEFFGIEGFNTATALARSATQTTATDVTLCAAVASASPYGAAAF